MPSPSLRSAALCAVLALLLVSLSATAAPVVTDFSPRSGPVGTLIRITGSGFTGVSQVLFTGRYIFAGRVPVPAQVFSVSENELYTVVPAGSVDDGRLTIVGPNNTRGYTPEPFALCGSALTIATLQWVCVGATATANVMDVPGATYEWTATNAEITSRPSSVITFKPTAAGPVTLSVVRRTPECPTGSHGVVQVTAGPPVAEYAFPDTICASSTVNVWATVRGPMESTFQWSVTGGTPLSPANSAGFMFQADPAGLVTLTLDVLACGVTTRVVSATIPIDAAPQPVISASDVVNPGGTSYASVVSAAGATYDWDITNGSIVGADTGSQVQFTAGESGTTRLTVTENACGRSGSTSKDIRIVSPQITSISPAVGAPGTVVHLYGIGLVDSLTANFGDGLGWMQAPVTVIDDTHVQATVPERSTTGPIQLNTRAGSVVSPKAFTICGTPLNWRYLPAGCASLNATVSVPDMEGATYSWTAENATIVSARDQASISYVPGAIGDARFTVVVVDPCGSTITMSQTYPSFPKGPAINGPSLVCPRAAFSVNSQANPPGAYWEVLNGEILPGAGTPTTPVILPYDSGFVTVRRFVPSCPGGAMLVSILEIPIGAPPARIDAAEAIPPNTRSMALAPLYNRATYRWDIEGGTLISPSSSPYATFTTAAAGPTKLTLTITACNGSSTAVKTFGPAATPSITGLSPAIGTTSGNQEVTITGSDLGATTEVRFGTNAATIVSASAAVVVVRTLAAPAGVVDVTLTAAGVSTTAAAAFRFVEPVVVATAPSSDPQNPAVLVAAGETSIVFGSVTAAGSTSVTEIDPATAGQVPQGYVIGEGKAAYEISTTATCAGPILIGFHVPDVDDEIAFNSLRVLHGENGVLVDRTILPPDAPAFDFANRMIYARVPSLSPFVIAQSRAPRIMAIEAPAAAVKRGSGATITAAFQDIDLETHTALVEWGDGSTSTAVVVESARTGTLTATHVYDAAGVFDARITIVDQAGLSSSSTFRSISVFDPAAGSLTAGGWFTSASAKSGKANFSGTAKYDRTGDLAGIFTLDLGETKLRSSGLSWLIVSNGIARLRGTAVIEGVGECVFIATFVDGSIAADGLDRIRVRISHSATGALVHDNAAALPDIFGPAGAMVIGGGDVTIHR